MPGKATGSVSDWTHVRSVARRKSKWTMGGCGALRRCGCAWTYKRTQFLCVKFRLGSAGEPTICSHCYDVLNEEIGFESIVVSTCKMYLYQEIYRALRHFLFFGWWWSECDVTYGILAMAAIVCWQSEANCTESKSGRNVCNTSDLVVLHGPAGGYCAFLCSDWDKRVVICDECASGEICSLQHMWVTGSVMWAVASGASLKFGVQGASATNWFGPVNSPRDNGIRLYQMNLDMTHPWLCARLQYLHW